MVQCNASKKNHPILIFRKIWLYPWKLQSFSTNYQGKLSPLLRIPPTWIFFPESNSHCHDYFSSNTK